MMSVNHWSLSKSGEAQLWRYGMTMTRSPVMLNGAM
jgi:hypothetical protein